MNIFIEGLQGSGKSTLLKKLSQKYQEYHVYREGDYCPIELAWCAYMTAEQYAAAINRFPILKKEIECRTTREEDKYIVEYTRIITAEREFYSYMEQYEIYNGRKTADDFNQIIFKRLRNLPVESAGNLFECAFFQNIIEELILFQQMSDDEICSFYRKLFDVIPKKDFRMYYLYSEDIEDSIMKIRKERCDEKGNQVWYQLLLKYLKESPYGKVYNFNGFEDVVSHFKHRQLVEMRIIREIIGDYAVILQAKKYTDEDLEVKVRSMS